MTGMLERVTTAFEEQFGEKPALVVRAPGRVNLIGEHTDYNDGFVLPMAIDQAIWIALRPRDGRLVRILSLDFDEVGEFHLDQIEPPQKSWLDYATGVARELQLAGHDLQGWEGVLSGDVPGGAGLSSSAALEMALARTFALVSDLAWDPAAMALLGQRVENEWIGVKTGIMDQMISASGQAGHALLIDCRSLETEAVPLPPGTVVVILDTSTRRGLIDSAYNERRQQCESAAAFFQVKALRDVSPTQFEAQAGQMDPLTRQRARHIVSENERVLRSVAAMRAGDPAALGRLMNESHASLQHDFQVSSEALDGMAACARQHEACYGARMTGGGFAGCAVALVRQDGVDRFAAEVAACYQDLTGLEPQLYVCHPSAGAAPVI